MTSILPGNTKKYLPRTYFFRNQAKPPISNELFIQMSIYFLISCNLVVFYCFYRPITLNINTDVDVYCSIRYVEQTSNLCLICTHFSVE